MKLKLKCVYTLILSLVILSTPITVKAAVSKGVIKYDNVVIDAKDITTLQNEIAATEKYMKDQIQTLVAQLNAIGTYFTAAGAVTHNAVQNSAFVPTYAQLKNAIAVSQQVQGDCVAITPQQVSSGYGGWVNGKWVAGNGSAETQAYNQGKADAQAQSYNAGYNAKYMEAYINALILKYDATGVTTQYHTHIGNSSSKSGCYQTPVYHRHVNGCYNALGKKVCNKTSSSIDSYRLSCGKNESTIVNVTLTF